MVEMNNIVLVNPASDWGRMKRIREASPPLGLLSLAAFLEKMGHGVDVIDDQHDLTGPKGIFSARASTPMAFSYSKLDPNPRGVNPDP